MKAKERIIQKIENLVYHAIKEEELTDAWTTKELKGYLIPSGIKEADIDLYIENYLKRPEFNITD